nr:hypothetical protein [uncultured Undibacterium sp.]
MTTKILTIRIPAPVYSTLCASAAELGVPVSAHVRRLIEHEHQAGQISQLRHELLAKLDQLTLPPANNAEPTMGLEEILLLSRAIAAHLNPQLVAQVRAKLINQQVGART